MLNIRKSTDVQKTPYFAIIYGKSGVGKTSLLATARKCLICDIEDGTKSIIGSDVLIAEIETYQDFLDAIAYAKKNGIENFCIDSLPRLYKIAMESVTKGVPLIQHYGKVNHMLTTLFWDIKKNQHFNVICTAQMETEKNEISGIIETGLNLSGKLAEDLPAIADFFGYMYVGKNNRRLIRTQPTETGINAKARISVPADMEPDLNILDKANINKYLGNKRIALIKKVALKAKEKFNGNQDDWHNFLFNNYQIKSTQGLTMEQALDCMNKLDEITSSNEEVKQIQEEAKKEEKTEKKSKKSK